MKTPKNPSEAPQLFTLDYVTRSQPKVETDRKTRIRQLIDQIQRGDGFKATELKAALGLHAWKAYRQQTKSAPSRMPKFLTSALRPYLAAVRRADAKTRKDEGKQRIGTPTQRFKLGSVKRSAESEYEHALELLEVIAEDYPGLSVWFDRPIEVDQFDNLTPDANGVPRLLASRSMYADTEVGDKELKNTALISLHDALTTCGLSKSTLQAHPHLYDALDWLNSEFEPELGSVSSSDIDGDPFSGLLYHL